MARGKRWTIPFKSLNGTSCRIDIYKDDYSGSTTVLSPNDPNSPGCAAANPITWQESDDESLLKVYRYKTGYIRLVERTNGSLSEMYPARNIDHYIEFYYGETMAFNGYIQAQSFENDFVAAPREISLPIMSPLGVGEGMRMLIVTPGNYTIGSLLKTCITQLDADYTQVLFPDVEPHFKGVIKSIVPIPFNDDFDYLESGLTDVYAPSYISEYIEAICNTYGWTVHDEPGKIVFSKFDHTGAYVRIWLDDLPNGTPVSQVESGGTVMSFSTFYTLSSADSTEGTILPKKEVTLDFGASPFKSYSYPFKRLSFVRKDQASYGVTAIWMNPVGPEIQDTSSFTTITSPNSLQDNGAFICAIGRPSDLKKMILISQPAQSSGVYLFKCMIYNVPKSLKSSVNFKIDGVVSKDLYFEDTDQSAILQCSIRAGSKYFNYDATAIGLNTWVDNEVRNLIWINPQGMPIIPMDVYTMPECEYIEMKFYSYPRTEDFKFIGITNISVNTPEDGAVEFDTNQTTKKSLRANNGSYETDSVSMMFTQQRSFINQIGNSVLPAQTDYAYMFQSQNILKLKCKQLYNYNYPYFAKWTYHIPGWYYRILSISFDPWDDNYTIILYRSPIL